MSTFWLAATTGGALCLIAASAWPGAVMITSGALEGVIQDGLSPYKGVPFAAAPAGEMRGREPRPVAPWKGTRKADVFAPACPQQGVSMPGETPPLTGEDCLYLNIWT